MYRKYHTQGIVIFGKAEGGDNKRVNIFTESFGLVSARAQSARNLHSKLRVGIQDFSFGEFSLVHGKTGWRVVSVRPIKNLFEVFRNDTEKLKIVSNILSLIKKLVGEEKAYSPLFEIVANFFVFLEKAKANEIILAECLTLMRILHCLGYMSNNPEFSLPIFSSEIQVPDLEMIAPHRSKIVQLINESLKAT
jgi:DNA repair protein RecO (recombination protein O)